jgi:hypothetical protein
MFTTETLPLNLKAEQRLEVSENVVQGNLFVFILRRFSVTKTILRPMTG